MGPEVAREIDSFVLNKPQYRQAAVLVAGQNFGCGSSREHAPWSIFGMGIRCIIAPSFADIFYNNCFKNGMLPVVLPEPQASPRPSCAPGAHCLPPGFAAEAAAFGRGAEAVPCAVGCKTSACGSCS
jgi:hypothetical protein